MEVHAMDNNSNRMSQRFPFGYEECVAGPAAVRADYVASPLAMAALLDWDEEDED